jgi:hypothetical protein
MGMFLNCGPKTASLMFLYDDSAYTSVTANGEEVADESEIIVEIGSEVELEVTLSTGFTFVGWYINPNFDDVGTGEPISATSSFTYPVEKDVFVLPKSNYNR